MQNIITWQQDRQVIHWTIKGSMKAVQLGQAIDQLQSELVKGASSVHILLNVEEAQSDNNVLNLFSTIIMPLLFHKRMGWLMMYGGGGQLKKMLKSQQALMTATRWRVFDTQAEAIDKLRAKVPNLQIQAFA